MATAVLAAALAACASAPPQAAPPMPQEQSPKGASVGSRAAQHAAKMVGAPYRFGGSNPSTGFDCSGLIQYSYRQAGLVIPRSTAEQRRAAVGVSDLREGDLLFFDQEGKKNSHAGIYLGNGYFIHAPSSGKRVRMDRLESPYWRRHLSEVRRLRSG